MCPRGVVPPLSLTPVSDHLLSHPQFFSIWFPFHPYVQFKASTFMHSLERRQAYDEAASRYRQDPAGLLGTSDTHAGSEGNTKMAAACAVCLHTAMSDVSTAHVKDILNEMVFLFSPSTLSLHCSFTENHFYCLPPLSLCRSIPPSPSPPPSLCFEQRPK